MASGFSFEATVTRWIDGDTVLVDPQVYPQDTFLRVRLKDVWEPERGEEGEDLARAKAEAAFPVGSRVSLTNTRVRWTYWRLEARVDPA
jgi:endonuclease YncB( thermonuclease family)